MSKKSKSVKTVNWIAAEEEVIFDEINRFFRIKITEVYWPGAANSYSRNIHGPYDTFVRLIWRRVCE